MTHDIRTLDDRAAERLLREVLQAADARLDDLPDLPMAEVRAVLHDAVQELGAQLPEAGDAMPAPIAKQSLLVLAQDPTYRGLITAAADGGMRPEAGRDFAVDPIAIVTASSLGLLVLNTYLNIERDARGRWTFQFKINPTSRAIQLELVRLLKSLVSAPPDQQ